MTYERGRMIPVVLAAVLALGELAPAAAGRQRALADTITVGPAASGDCRTLDRGDLLVVRLPSNPSTGYAWKVAGGVDRMLALAGRAYVPPTDATRVGAPGTAILRFRAATPGSARLRLVYVRPWEKSVAPQRTFTLRVTVR